MDPIYKARTFTEIKKLGDEKMGVRLTVKDIYRSETRRQGVLVTVKEYTFNMKALERQPVLTDGDVCTILWALGVRASPVDGNDEEHICLNCPRELLGMGCAYNMVKKANKKVERKK